MNIVRLMLLSRQMKNRRHEKDNMVTGIPPLTFTAKKTGTLKNYRIYGNTVNGESVGDRTGNLFDYTTTSGTNGVRLNSDGSEIRDLQWSITDYIPCDGLVFTINKIGGLSPAICLYDASKTFIVGKAYNTPSAQIKASVTISSNAPAKYIRFSYFISNDYPVAIDDLTKIMLNEGSTALPYEPYGYRVPVTVSNGTDSQTISIYLPEQIKKVGDEAEYIDYGEQKMHRVTDDRYEPYIENTEVDVTLPALPVLPGTNTLTVGTEVQPSRVELTGRIKEGES